MDRYLRDDVPGLMRQCDECKVEQEAADPDEQCAICPKWKTIESYSEAFRSFMLWLLDLYDRQQAGWTIRNNDLTLDEWRALARVRGHYEAKRQELMAQMMKRQT